MKKYHIYFEIYGKKMKTSLYAISKVQAENIVRSKLNIIRIDDTGIEKGSIADAATDDLGALDEFMNLFKGK